MRLFHALAALIAALPLPALAINSNCIALSRDLPNATYAALGGFDALTPKQVRIHYIGHSTFVIETAAGTLAATDFTGYVGAGVRPDVVTMNHAHSSHYTNSPDPSIPHILRGWGTEGTPAAHFLEVDDMLVRNVTTDIRGGYEVRVPDDNSIFIFEVAGLCIGHLGHLHHDLSTGHYASIGRLDVVMAPVDGGTTVDLPTMLTIMKRLRARVVLPMHWSGTYALGVFASGMEQDGFDIQNEGASNVVLTLADLPRTPKVVVLQPRYLDAQQ